MKCRTCQAELVKGVCPECGEYKKAQDKPAGFPLGYQQCEWLSGQDRCRYPGSISTNTHEGGPYYCRLHFGCESGHFGAQIVEASQDYRHPTEDELAAEHTRKARERLGPLGLLKAQEESPEAYRARCMAFMKSKVTYRKVA